MSTLGSLFPTEETEGPGGGPLGAALFWSVGGVLQSKGKCCSYTSNAVLIGRFFQGSTSALPLVLGFSLKVSSLWVVASWFLCESNSNLDHLFCLLLTFYYPFNVNGINSCRTTSFLILTICVFSLSFQGTKFSLILFIDFLFLILLASFLIFIISFLCLF